MASNYTPETEIYGLRLEQDESSVTVTVHSKYLKIPKIKVLFESVIKEITSEINKGRPKPMSD